MEFEFKQLSSNLLKDLHLLFSASGKRMSLIQIKKKYDTKKFGVEYIGFIAYDASNNLPVGFYGVLPVEAIHLDKKIIIAQSADTITHPKYRKLGIFKILAEKTYALCKESSIDFIFGIPNYNSFHGFIKYLAWQDRGRFVVFTKKIKTIPLNALINKTKFFQSFYFVYVRLVLWFFGKRNKFIFRDSNKNEFCISKSKDYLEYKSSRGHFHVEIKDVKLILSFKGYLKIGEYTESKGDFSKIHLSLKILAFLTGSHKIVFQKLDFFCSENHKKEFSGYKISEGLPFIQKKINENRFNNEILNINYFDFDTF
jgi:hypothetical protein